MQEILINIEAGERRVAILSSKRLEWYFVERIPEKRTVGNIYKGKVNSVLDGMGAAFVDCGFERNGFLYVSDIIAPAPESEEEDLEFFFPQNQTRQDNSNPKPISDSRYSRRDNRISEQVKISEIIKKGEDILVQVTKEELGRKGVRLTTHLSLPGRYLVLMPTSKRIGVSRRIKDGQERLRIRNTLQEFKLPKEMGLVARTAAVGCSKREFARDLNYLLNTYNSINRLAKQEQAPALLFEELDLSLKIIRDFLGEDTAKIIIDDKEEYKKLKHFTAKIAPKFGNRIYLYREDLPLFERYDIEKKIDRLFESKIFLKCGGYITIEQTEGMVAIDVNSGKFTSKRSLEDTVFKVNCEAAEEIARQLRLRDVGGIVIIDFIDMESRQHRKEVFSILQNALKKDRARTHIVSMSELDIVEMTRQRVRRSLESVSYQNCPYCEGKGRVKSAATMTIIALRKLKAFLRSHKARRGSVELLVHPFVAQRLVKEDSPSLDFIRRSFKRQISVVADDSLHIEDSRIEFGR